MLNQFVTRNIWKTALMPVLDYGALLTAGAIAYILRYKVFFESFEGIKQIYGFQYVTVVLVVSAVIVAVFALQGLYSISHKPRFLQAIIHMTIGIWFVMLLIIAFLYFNEYNSLQIVLNFTISRFIVGTYVLLATFCVFASRLMVRGVEYTLFSHSIGVYDVLLIGSPSQRISYIPTLVSFFDRMPFVRHAYHYPHLNDEAMNEISQKIESGHVGEIYVLCTPEHTEYEQKLSVLAERSKVRFLFTPEGYAQFELYHVNPIIIENEYFFEMYYTAIRGWNIVLKRIFDVVVSLAFVILFSWLYIIIAIVIKLDSPGSVLYASERVAPNGSIFKMYKFRRFKAEFNTSEQDPHAKKALEFEAKLIESQGETAHRGALYKIKDDPRMTRVGKFLEKTSLDELPQFFNVIIGNLSLVGPRAHQPREVKKYHDHHFKVLNIKPGITGFAQIKGRSDLSFDEEVVFDTYYVHNWSFLFDIWILLQTPFIIIFKRHKS